MVPTHEIRPETAMGLEEVRPGDGFGALPHLSWGALEDEASALVAATGTEFDGVVAGLDHLKIVLDEEDGVALVDHAVEEFEDAVDVVEVQSVGRLVEDEDLALVAEEGSQLDALQLASR